MNKGESTGFYDIKRSNYTTEKYPSHSMEPSYIDTSQIKRPSIDDENDQSPLSSPHSRGPRIVKEKNNHTSDKVLTTNENNSSFDAKIISIPGQNHGN